MKQIFSLTLALMMSISISYACKAKSVQPLAAHPSPLTVIVMDTTQALLSGAEVKIGKTVLRSSFDGRVVIQPKQLEGARSFSVTCKGYQSKKIKPEGSNVLLVQLTPQKQKSSKKEEIPDLYFARDTRTRKVHGEAPMLMATSDYAVMELRSEGISELESEGVMELPAMNNSAQAGMLTAGEVNDFAKWSLWSSYQQSSSNYLQTWRLNPSERYTVTVMDTHGYPIANHPVSLYDTHGNTVFQALTDNTGKAELWNGLTVNGERIAVNEPQKLIIIDEPCINDQINDPYGEADRSTVGRLEMVNEEMVNSSDVVFIFDATGSMGDELRYLQAEMKDVIARASDATGGLRIRTGAVVYRDHGDDYVTRLSRLTDDISVTQAFIDKQEAYGGGDYPEAIPEALMAGLNSAGWNENARARIAFLVLDAPCHEDSATLALLHEQILNAAAMGVRIVPVVCSGLGESGEYLLRSIALATNGTSFFLTDDSGIGHTHLKPTTDTLIVEHLNDMLVRTIVEFSYMPDCTGHWRKEQIEQVNEQFIPDPFDAKDLAENPALPHGPTTLYLLDVSGKLITIYEGRLEEASDSQLSPLALHLSTGIYFIKAFYDGEWHTKKILVH